jgi:hypothetical protein
LLLQAGFLAKTRHAERISVFEQRHAFSLCPLVQWKPGIVLAVTEKDFSSLEEAI